jgi:hypothetical protein
MEYSKLKLAKTGKSFYRDLRGCVKRKVLYNRNPQSRRRVVSF